MVAPRIGKHAMGLIGCLLNSNMDEFPAQAASLREADQALAAPPGHADLARSAAAQRVVRSQHSHPIVAGAFANVGINGPLKKSILVELWI